MPQPETDNLLHELDALSELGRAAQALKRATAALAQEPDNLDLLLRAAQYASQLEDYSQASDFASRAAALAPQWSFPLALLAQQRRFAGDVPGAIQAAQAALHLDPEEGLAHFELGIIEAVKADNASIFTRRPHVQRARQAAQQLDRLWPESAHGPALLAMLSAIERRWRDHDAALARALAREPQDAFTHSVRLMGLQYRRARQLIPDLMGRLREQPEDHYARETLREQFGYTGWLQLMGNRQPFLLALLSLPIYGLWRTGRILRHRDAYQAAFSVSERRRDTLKHLTLPPLALVMVFMLLEHFYPLAFTTRPLFYGPLWLLIGLFVLMVAVPAIFGGQGGFFGRSEQAVPCPRPQPRPLTFRRLIGPLLLGLLATLTVVLTVAILVLALLDKSSSLLSAVPSLLILGALSAALILMTLKAVERARYGEVPAGRLSLNDALVTLVTFFALAFTVDSFWPAWQTRYERRGTVALSGQPLSYWIYEPGSALDDLISRRKKSCALPEGSRYVVIAVPKTRSAPLTLQGVAATVREDLGQTRCLRAVPVQSAFSLRAFPWAGRPQQVQQSRRLSKARNPVDRKGGAD